MDVISLAAWALGALAGLAAGLFRLWLPVLFLLAALGLAGGFGILIGPGIFFFMESESGQALAGFSLVFAAMAAIGVMVTAAMWKLLSAGSSLISLLPVGALLNWAGGLLLGAFAGLMLVSVILISLQQYPVPSVGRAIAKSSLASGPIHWVDRYVASLEISGEWQ